VKKQSWLILGAAALFLLSRRTAAQETSGGGGGGSTSGDGLGDFLNWLKGLFNGSAGGGGTVLQPNPDNTQQPGAWTPAQRTGLGAQLFAAGATIQAVNSGILATATAQPGQYWISPQGGILKSNFPSALLPRGGYEAISPSGQGSSTASWYIANNISRGLNAVNPPVYQGTMYVAGQGFVSTKGTVFR
jgi:hypothetical protein